MKIKCIDCGFYEEVDLDFFVKIIGGATAGFGFWAWTSFLFAGTGLAMPICIAIVASGVGMLAYKDEIIDWIANEGYECNSCGNKNWAAVSPVTEKQINANEESLSIKIEAQALQKRVSIIEALLRSKDCEFELEGSTWLILESSGDLKEINSIDELELYAISL